MMLSSMRFAGYEWEYNPVSISIDKKRILSGYKTVSDREIVQNVTEDFSVVSGEGELVGEDCTEQYKAIEKLFERNRAGVLTLPGMKPFFAYFTGLSVQGSEAKGVLRYKFEFTRDRAGRKDTERFHICKEGESLFDIAYEYSTDVEKLAALNPQLKRPDNLKEGERVRVC